MKKVIAKYISNGTVREGILIDTVEGAYKALDNYLISSFSLNHIIKCVKNNKPVFVNEQRGYCPIEGTWEVITVITE